MDSSETVRLLKLALKISRFLATSPYTWSDGKVHFPGRKALIYVTFFAQFLLYMSYMAFVFARWIQISYLVPNSTTTEKNGLLYAVFSYSIPALIHLTFFYHTDRLHILFNRMIWYQQSSLRGKFKLTELLKVNSINFVAY